MAFSFEKSNAGPSPLSISTTNANSAFGTSTTNSQPATSNNMFGALSNTAGNQPSTLFGGSKPAGPSLFGASASQPAQTGNIFGGLGQTTSDQNKQTQPNIFGGLGSTQQNTQQQQPGGLFGSLNQNKPAESNMFSGLGQTDAQKQQQQQQQAAQPRPYGSTFGGLSFGQSTNNNPQTASVPGVKINLDNLRPTTRFNDCHEELQKIIETVDNHIQQQMQQKSDCDAIMPKHEEQLLAVPNDVDFLTRRCNDLENALASDAEGIFQAKKLIQADGAAAKLSADAINNLRLPTQFQQLGPWSGATSSSVAVNAQLSSSIPKYFMREADEMIATLGVYEKNMSEIEAHLRDVEAKTVHQFMQSQSRARNDDPNEQIRELAGAFRDFENGMLYVAGKVVGLKEDVDQIKRGGLLSDVGTDNSRTTRRGVY